MLGDVMEMKGETGRMKSDIAVTPVAVGARRLSWAPRCPLVMKGSGFSANNGGEESKLMARLCQPKWQSITPLSQFHPE